MNSGLFKITVIGLIAIGLPLAFAQDEEKSSKDKKPTTAEREVIEADELLDELSSTNKGKLTKLVNSGTEKDLIALPGIGKVTAGRIIEARPLESTAHLVTIKNIGLKTMEKIVTFVDEGGLSTSASSTKSKSKSTKSKS